MKQPSNLRSGAGPCLALAAALLPAWLQAADPAQVTAQESLGQRYDRTCGICHTRRLGGAPGLKNATDWSHRIRQGMPILLQHTIEGFNDMPPLGQCMDCESEDLEALIRFMADLP